MAYWVLTRSGCNVQGHYSSESKNITKWFMLGKRNNALPYIVFHIHIKMSLPNHIPSRSQHYEGNGR